MNKELATLTLKFLERVQLVGGEVPAFNAVVTALQGVSDPEVEKSEKPEEKTSE